MGKVESSNKQFSIFIVRFSVLREVTDREILDVMYGKCWLPSEAIGYHNGNEETAWPEKTKVGIETQFLVLTIRVQLPQP